MKVSETQHEALRALADRGGVIDGGSQYVARGRFVRSPVLLFTACGTFTLATLRALTKAGLVKVLGSRVALTAEGKNFVKEIK